MKEHKDMQSKWLAKGTSAVAIVALMATVTINPPAAHAGVPGLFATEYTQLLNYVELIGSLEKQVEQVENQFTQIADMTKHGITITDQLFGTVASDISNLRQIVNTGQALSYTMSNMDGAFRVRFPGYATNTNYGQSYQTWSQTSLDSTRGALNAAGLQNAQFDSDSALLQTLQQQSTSAVGRMQAIEVGNQIAENQAEQLMKLRQLMMADMQSKAAYQGALVQAESTKQANSDAFFGQAQITSDGVVF
jgi:type IV secretion system protein TrbJ